MGGKATFRKSVVKRAGANVNTISVSNGGYLDFQESTIKDSGSTGISFSGADSRLLVKNSKIENVSTGITLSLHKLPPLCGLTRRHPTH